MDPRSAIAAIYDVLSDDRDENIELLLAVAAGIAVSTQMPLDVFLGRFLGRWRLAERHYLGDE